MNFDHAWAEHYPVTLSLEQGHNNQTNTVIGYTVYMDFCLTNFAMPTFILLKHCGGGMNLCQCDQGHHMLYAIINRGQELTRTCTCSMIKFHQSI